MKNNMEWIPISNPPKKDGKYFVTRHYFDFDRVEILSYANNLYQIDKYDFWYTKRAGWYDYDSGHGYYECEGITAWCELPEPYKKSEGEEC